MPDYTDTNLGSIVYNVLTTAKYTELQQGGNINSNELYLITDDSGGGGSGPSPYASNPAMDGTASPGSSADYARGDHVHPTDTSRQATLVSGTNIKTINNESLLGSGNISISGGTTEIFIATYGTTTNAAVTAALTANKTVFATRTDSGVTRYLPLNEENAGGTYIFSMEYGECEIYYQLDTNDNWTEITTNLAPKNSPSFTGNPTAPTQTAGNNSGRIATTSFVQTAVNDRAEIITYDDNSISYSDITTMVAAGKILFCHYSTASDDVTLPYVCTTDDNKHVFTNMVGNTRWTLYINSSNTWSVSSAALVPAARTINSKDLTNNITLTAADVDAGKCIDSKTSISSLANLQTQLTTWFGNCSNGSSNIYYITCSGTWSPFASGLGVIVRLEKGTTSGQAFFTGRSDANTPCAAMMANNSGTWSGFTNISTGGGSAPTTTTASLAVASWSNKSITVTVSGVTSSNLVIVSPAPASATTWANCGVICSSQSTNSLTFTCETTPTSALTANVAIFG